MAGLLLWLIPVRSNVRKKSVLWLMVLGVTVLSDELMAAGVAPPIEASVPSYGCLYLT